MNLETKMKISQWNLTRLLIIEERAHLRREMDKPFYPSEHLERWGQFYVDHEFLRLITFERFLTNPIFWIKCLGEQE